MNAIKHIDYWKSGTCAMLLVSRDGKRKMAYGKSQRVYSVIMRYFCHVPGVGYIPRKAAK